jgi:hypothetical protein
MHINSGAITGNTPNLYCVGRTGPGGGIIFYYSTAGFNCGTGFISTGSPTGVLCHYLEAATPDWIDAGYAWSATFATVATSPGIGSGYKNTLAIIVQDSTSGRAGTISQAYRGPSNLDDWYLPSKDELNELWVNRAFVEEGLASYSLDYYWSSSESASTAAFRQSFNDGFQSSGGSKAGIEFVRPVRAF